MRSAKKLTIKFYLAAGVRNRKCYLAPNDSYEKFYLAVKGLNSIVEDGRVHLHLGVLWVMGGGVGAFPRQPGRLDDQYRWTLGWRFRGAR